GSVGGGTTVGASGSVQAGDPKAGGAVTGGASVGATTSWGGQSGSSWGGGGGTGAAGPEGVRLRIAADWSIQVLQNISVNTVASILTLGGANLGATLAEHSSSDATATSNGVVRLPKVRCTPA